METTHLNEVDANAEQEANMTDSPTTTTTAAEIPSTPPSAPVAAAAPSPNKTSGKPKQKCYLQNRELSWLTFNERVLDQGADETVPLLERLTFVSIFSSNLQEFFMVRVGSLTDLSLLKKAVLDNKTQMTPSEQLDAVYARCNELYPAQERIFQDVRRKLSHASVKHLKASELSDEQVIFLLNYLESNVMPFLSPQIINSRHPFPHLENGALYVLVRLNEKLESAEKEAAKAAKKREKNLPAEGVTLGLVPLPKQCKRVIELPGEGLQFILIEHAIEMAAAEIFSMYTIKHTNVMCVTRNADLDATEGTDESDEDYRDHMKRILKKRARLAPVRLECERKLSSVMEEFLLKRLRLKKQQVFTTSVPLDMGYAWGLASMVDADLRKKLTSGPFVPQWPSCFDRNRPVFDQVREKEVLLSYPYETMDAFVQLLREAAVDPSVVSIKITLYRLASQSHLAEALIAAAENGKEVTALFELRARFDENNNIEWSQRFEEAGAKVIYGFREYKVHSKICCITRQTEKGVQYITQLGTGNYNEKTAKLYTDLSFITTDETIGRDATEFFHNMALENASTNYELLWVAPLQIKPFILAGIDKQIERASKGEAAELLFKTNSVTDKDIIEKIVEASQAGVKVTLIVRGISCLVPQLQGYTDNIRVVSIVGRLLEHSRIYGFGPRESMRIYLSSADLMTRNMDKRVEIGWPVLNQTLRDRILDSVDIMMLDTTKLRELQADKSYTPLGYFAPVDENSERVLFDSQEFFIKEAYTARKQAAAEEAQRDANRNAQLATDPISLAAQAAEKAARIAQAAEKAAEAAAEIAESSAAVILEKEKSLEEVQAQKNQVSKGTNPSVGAPDSLTKETKATTAEATNDSLPAAKPANTPAVIAQDAPVNSASAVPTASRPLPSPPQPEPETEKPRKRGFFARLFSFIKK